MTEAIGMMEGAFFVSRGELIMWINKTYSLNVTKIEQLGAGSVYCQILDSIHPGKVNMSRVNWKAKLEWEFVNNLKVLQQSFLKCNLNKHIEVEKLAKAKYQDNLEFAQWMKRYYDLNGGANRDYDPIARRGGVEPDFSFAEKIPSRVDKIEKSEKIMNMHQGSGDKEKEKDKDKEKDRDREKINFRVAYGGGDVPIRSKAKDKDMRSYSPSLKNLNKDAKSVLLKERFSHIKNDQELVQEIKSLHRQLLEIKILTLEKNKPDETFKKILECTNQALSNKLFLKEKNNAKANNIDKISEDDGLEESKNNN